MGEYVKRFGLNHAICIKCDFRYETQVGNLDSVIEVQALAESLHRSNSPKCKNRYLVIEGVELYYEVKKLKK